MSEDLSEEETRLALFGPADNAIQAPPVTAKSTAVMPKPSPMYRPKARAHSPRLRVTLHVSKEFEGNVEVFSYDANTLSTLVAEQEAKSAAKNKNSNTSMSYQLIPSRVLLWTTPHCLLIRMPLMWSLLDYLHICYRYV